jgi:hypothetical protein
LVSRLYLADVTEAGAPVVAGLLHERRELVEALLALAAEECLRLLDRVILLCHWRSR